MTLNEDITVIVSDILAMSKDGFHAATTRLGEYQVQAVKQSESALLNT